MKIRVEYRIIQAARRLDQQEIKEFIGFQIAQDF